MTEIAPALVPLLVTLPLLGPAIAVALLFRYIFAFRIFSEVWLMTQGGPCRGPSCATPITCAVRMPL